MLATGMVRKIDNLGRIVIPKEIRRSLKISSGDDLELFIEGDCLMLKKFQAINKYFTVAKSYCDTIYDNIHTNIFICSKEKVVSSSGGAPLLQISAELLDVINSGNNVYLKKDGVFPLFSEGAFNYTFQFICPVRCMGDIYGAIVAYGTKQAELKEEEQNLIKSAALLLCGQLS